jgi:hypothetical protein
VTERGRLPHVLEPSEEWAGCIEQTGKIEGIAKTSFLYCVVYHSSSDKPAMKKVLLNKNRAA